MHELYLESDEGSCRNQGMYGDVIITIYIFLADDVIRNLHTGEILGTTYH